MQQKKQYRYYTHHGKIYRYQINNKKQTKKPIDQEKPLCAL